MHIKTINACKYVCTCSTYVQYICSYVALIKALAIEWLYSDFFAYIQEHCKIRNHNFRFSYCTYVCT